MSRRKPTEEQRARAQERRAKFKELWKNVAAMPELERVQMSNRLGIVNCDGQALSVKNQCLLAFQCQNVSVVGGFRQWLKHGRCVRKGEHGHMIWIPTFGAKAAEVSEPGDGETAEAAERRFIIGTVFDISQTDELGSEPAEVSDEELLAALV